MVIPGTYPAPGRREGAVRNRCREEPRSGDVAISPKPTGLLRPLRGLAVTAIPLQRTVNWSQCTGVAEAISVIKAAMRVACPMIASAR